MCVWCVIMLPKYLRSTAYGREHAKCYDDPAPITIPERNSGVIKLPELQIFHRIPEDWPNDSNKCIPPLASIFYVETDAKKGKALKVKSSNGSIGGPDAPNGRIGMLVDTNLKKVVFTHNTQVVCEYSLTLTPPLYLPPAADLGNGLLPNDGFVFDVMEYIRSSQSTAKHSLDELQNMVSEYLHFYGYSISTYSELRKQVRKNLHARNYAAVREAFTQMNMPPEVTFELDLLELAETFVNNPDTHELNQALSHAHKLLMDHPTKSKELQAVSSLLLKKGEVNSLKVFNACCMELNRRELYDQGYITQPHYKLYDDLSLDELPKGLPKLYSLFSK